MSRLKAVVVVILLVGGAGAGALFGLNMFYQERLQEHMTARLAGAEQDLVAHLRLKAFEGIQRLWRISEDEKLQNAMTKFPSSSGDLENDALKKALEPAHELLVPWLEAVHKKVKTGRLQVLTMDGHVVAQIPGDGFGASMKGLPAFQDCVAGVARDGIYELEGKPEQIAVVPLHTTRGQVGGCLLSATALGNEQLQDWSSRTGLHATLFLRNKAAASTLDASKLEPLAEQLDASETVFFGVPPDPGPLFSDLNNMGYAARVAKLSTGTDGLAAAVVLPAAAMLEPWKKAQNLLFMGTGALFVVGLLLGLLLSGKGKDKQLQQLADDVEMLSTGSMTSIEPGKYSGPHEQIALGIQRLGPARPAAAGFNADASVSEILGTPAEPGEPAPGPGGEGGELDFESLLQPGGDQQAAALEPAEPPAAPEPPPAVPAVPPAPAAPPPEQQPAPPPQPVPAETPPPPPAAVPPSPGAHSGPRVELPGELAGIFDEAEETREVEPLIPPQARPDESAQAVRPAAPPPPPAAPPPSAPPDLDQGDEDQIKSSDYRPDATVIAQVPDELLKASASAETGSGATESASRQTQLPRPPVVPPPPEPPVRQAPAEDSHFREVFEKFVQTKKECGESTSGLTMERFSDKLRKNTADLKTRYKCRSVKFQVYVKNGKAALKATPIK